MAKTERKYTAWYTHEIFVRTLSELQEMAKDVGINLSDNPTDEEVAKVYKEVFSEMSDPWEVTANGKCKVEKVP